MLVRLSRFFAFVFLFALLARGPLSAQDTPPRITATNAADLRLLAEAPISNYGRPQLRWTADGGLAVGMFEGMNTTAGRVHFMPGWQGMDSTFETLALDVDGVYDLAAHPTRPQIALGTRSQVLLYDLTTRTPVLTIDHMAVALAYSPDGRLLALRDTQDTVLVWDTTTNQPVATLTDVTTPTGLAFSPDGTTLSIGNIEGDVYLWDVASQQGRWMERADAADHGPGGGGSPDHSVQYSPDGRFLTSVSFWEFGTVRLWALDSGQVRAALAPLPEVNESILFDATAFSPASDLVATTGGQSGNTNAGVYLWDVAAVTASPTPTAHDWVAHLPHHAVSSVAFSPDGTLVASAGGGMVRLWALNVPTQTELAARHTANVVAYCQTLDETPAPVEAGQRVGLVWSWYATTPDLLADHLSSAQYDVQLDGEPLAGWRLLSQPQPDAANAGHWTAYYYVETPALSAGTHRVDYALRWAYAISDGIGTFGPGTATEQESGGCTFEAR